ncbi:MAG TPA: family 16 glycoside hydrolase [Opitutales bacterium]|nr:family 16 glycoside hydrolase [Opitutales bacterium]
MSPAPLLLAVLAQVAPAPTPATTPAVPTAAPAAGPALPPNPAPAPGFGWLPLFNGENLDGWYTFRARDGKNNDVQQVFKAANGVIHVLDVDPAVAQPNGYLATNEEFRNYRLRLEYQWGAIKLPVPRHPEGLPRDAGLLYHMTGPDAVWPICVEFQIQEHDTGDAWLLPNLPRPNPTANTTALAGADGQPLQKQPGNYTYAEGGVPVLDKGGRIFHSAPYDTMDGWNSVELFATENNAIHVVNGHVNNAMFNLQLPNEGGPMAQGKILLQEENNEVFYRQVEIQPLFADRFGGPPYKVLVVGVDAKSPAAIAIGKLGRQNNFTVEVGATASFTDDSLKQYKAVVFCGPPDPGLTSAQRVAFQHYSHAGGGYVGINAAANSASDWGWYGHFVGAEVDNTTDGIQAQGIKLNDSDHASTSSLPLTWAHPEYVPHFKLDENIKVHLLATALDAANAEGSGANPVAWCNVFDGGRMFFTALGANEKDFSDPLFLLHLLGGIKYAAGTDGTPPPGATVLFDGKDTSHWIGKDNTTCTWNFHDGVIEPPPATYPNGIRVMTGDLHTKETYTDFQLHVEFKVPGTKSPETRNAETNEQARGNSGIYLQGRYEMQILDSFDHPLEGKNDEGAIYEVKDAAVNAALPAGLWQSYDLTFHAARWQDGKKIADARVTAYLNGVLVQNDTAIPGPTRSSMLTDDGPAPGPITLQDHLNPVQFRLVWIKPLADPK